MGCKSKYIKSQIDYGMYKSKNARRIGTHIIRNKQKIELQKELNQYNEESGFNVKEL